MKPWALVPVKGFARGKSRLGALLDGESGLELAQAMFDRVIGDVLVPLSRAGELGGVAVVTDGEDVLARARRLGVQSWLAPSTGPGRALSAVVDEALVRLVEAGAPAALVLMGDLPALTADDVRALGALLAEVDVVLAPDEVGSGTNALAVRLPPPMPSCFCGGASYQAHVTGAAARGLRLAVCDRPGLRFDIDDPADYARFLARR